MNLKAFIEKLFHLRSRLVLIQINDEEIDNDIAHLIINAEKSIRDLQSALKSDDIETKDQKSEELLGLFDKMLVDVDRLINDIAKLRLEELNKQDYVKINDARYLEDKIQQLGVIKQAITELIEVMHEHPSDKEYEEGVLDKVFEEMNRMIDALNKCKQDDIYLKKIYEQASKQSPQNKNSPGKTPVNVKTK